MSEPTIRYSTLDDGTTELDEIIANGCDFHMEAMDDGQWWIEISLGDRSWHINVGVENARPIPYFFIEEVS